MTDKEKAIVMAYTGICMLSGDKFQIFHKYVEDIMGRPVYTHEMADQAVVDKIKEKAKVDFIALCEEQEPKTGHWVLFGECSNSEYYCSECHKKVVKEGWSNTVKKIKFCPNCGAKMVKPQESEEEEMTSGEAIKRIKSGLCRNCGIYLGGGKCPENCYVIESINALSAEPCGDAISRQVVKNKYRESLVNNLKDDNKGIDLSKYAEEPYRAFCEFMDSIPPVIPQPNTGHWIKSKDGYMRCDKCGSRGSAIKARFCHHCGRRMIELQESEREDTPEVPQDKS